jgi:methylmalonyl-CoA mutase N-terminal domain/subunit
VASRRERIIARVRTAIEALASVLGGTQSMHTNSLNEVLALPADKAARIALRTQQVLVHVTGVATVADPLGGSWFFESLTDEVCEKAEAVFAYLDQLRDGSLLDGVVAAIEANWFQPEIADASYRFQRRVSSGRSIIVGVHDFTGPNEDSDLPTLHIGPEVEEVQRKRLDEVKRHRNGAAGMARLATDAADSSSNLTLAILDATRACATIGGMVESLAGGFGRWRERAVT